MTPRRSQLVDFRRPFELSGLGSLQWASTYRAEKGEEQLDILTVAAWRRTDTDVQLEWAGSTEHLPVDPSELHEVLIRDGVLPYFAPPRSDRGLGLDMPATL